MPNNKATDYQTICVDFINDIIDAEYEISSCLNACNMAQMRAIKLMDELRSSDIVPFDQTLNKKKRGTNNLLLIHDTLKALRCKLEQGLTSNDYVNPFRSIPAAIKHSIQARALIQTSNYLKATLKTKQGDQQKYDELILQNSNDECVDILLEERMKTEMEIECLMKKIKNVKKKLTEQYGCGYGKAQHQSISEEIEVCADNKCDQRSVGIQTSSAMNGFMNDSSAQTLERSLRPVTLCTQTRVQSLIYSSRCPSSNQEEDDDVKKKDSVDLELTHEHNSWYRQDLELPKSKKRINRFMTRWFFNIDDDKHYVEIRYAKIVGHAPEVVLDGVKIDFTKAYKTFRRIYDGKNWRILMRAYNCDILVKSVNGFDYKLVIGGVPFGKIKKMVTAKEWN